MTGAAPAESRSKRVVVESEMVVAEVLEAAGKAAPSQDAFLDGLRKQLVANIRLLRDDEIPEEDVDEERVERVRALQAEVSSLAGRVQAARDEYIPLLEKDALLSAQSLTERLTALPSDVVDSSTSVRACLANVTEAKRVLKRASSNCSNSERMERVSDDVKATNKRARNVLDTLRIVSENAPDEESNNTITITMDGESLMLDASTPRKASVATPSIRREDQEPAGTIPVAAQMNTTPPTSRGTPGTSTRPRALAIECSPHVTPRSRERRRVSASPRPPRSALPR